MKAKKRAALWLTVCAAALSGLLFLLAREPDTKAAVTAETTVYPIVDLSVADIAAVKVENGSASFAVLQGPDGVEMVSRSANAYDATQMRAFLYAAAHITGSRRVTDASAFANYGADAPRATVTLYLADNAQRVLEVLADHPLGEGTYLYDKEGNAIYLVAREVAALFLRTEQDFIAHTLFPLSTREDYAQIERIVLQYGGTGRDYTVEQTDQGYSLTVPVRLRLSQDRVYANLLDPVLQLYADTILATDADPAAYGLDQPELTLTLTIAGETRRAVLRRTDGNRCLMADPDGHTVYQLDDAPLLSLLQDYTTLVGGSIVTYAAGDLQDVTLTRDGASLFLTFSGSGDSLSVRVGAAELDRAERTALLQALNGLTPTGELSASATGTPVFQWTATLRTGAVETVALLPLGQELYAVSINGEAAFVTDAQALSSLQTQFDALNDLEKKE